MRGEADLTPRARWIWNQAGGQLGLQVRAIITLTGSMKHHAATINAPCACTITLPSPPQPMLDEVIGRGLVPRAIPV
jgi:hypothetical protein